MSCYGRHLVLIVVWSWSVLAFADGVPCISGIYPHLAMYNNEAECGTGAVVPWAGRLWAVTYAPHKPGGSSDKLYEITEELHQIVRPESIGGTPANRMIHQESQQLFIGPYAIDSQRRVRTIPYSAMFGRHTGNARHLTDPANKIYYATMEEGFYEVDVKTLAVTELFKDGNVQSGDLGGTLLPGYHGKGFYMGQGRVIYANNGERGSKALVDPTIESGVLAEWRGPGSEWRVIRRNQFTEVTGPGGIMGSRAPESDPVWSMGWDSRSLMLMTLDQGRWHLWRLPKGSHSYDGAHGWNTEWPRIREIGAGDTFLATMHGTFWHFPKDFGATRSAGLRPRSNYLKVVGDFCYWQERVVLGCDDSARSEFLNKRGSKGTIKGPGQSNSNLWFIEPAALDHLGPVIGRGAVWQGDAVKAGVPSDPYLFNGYTRRSLYLAHGEEESVKFALEVDHGDGRWQPLREIEALPHKLTVVHFDPAAPGAWLRLVPRANAAKLYACFQYANLDERGVVANPIFNGVADTNTQSGVGGIIYARGANKRTLGMAAWAAAASGVTPSGFYELDGALKLRRVNDDPNAFNYATNSYPLNGKGLMVEAASAVITDDAGRRWRFPKAGRAWDAPGLWGSERLCREVCTERDLLNVCGTFYELPAENAGGFGKVRAIATHARHIHDYCSFRGLLVLSGIQDGAVAAEHIVRSEDGKVAVWVGVVEDLWQFGKARGEGGPWLATAVAANEPSDPYLMTGFDRKKLTLRHNSTSGVGMRLELDITGSGVWREYATYTVPTGQPLVVTLDDVRAYWVRFVADTPCVASAILRYE